MVGCHGWLLFPVVAWSSPAVASWLLRSLCLAVAVGCHGWWLFPAVLSSLPMVVSWLLQLFHLAVVVGCHGCTIVMDAFVAVALVVVVVGCCG